jgi:6-phosphogluconolactonase (cycloisomerase 2 family)
MEGVHTHAEHAAPRLLAFLLTLATVLVTMSVAADVSLARDGEEGDGKGGSGAGAVFSMTNESSQNAVVAYERGSDGRLRDPRRFSTGGTGTGTPEDSLDGLVLADRRGEVSPINLREGGRFLLATNAGSDTVSVFRVRGSDLELVDVEASGGDRPTSVTVSRGVVYVMNAGGAMCTGTTPEQNLSGFRIDNDGELEPIPGSTRPLTGQTASGCTQASFDKSGDVVVVTEQQADVISTYTRNRDGTLNGPNAQQTTGNGPFGSTFTQRNQLITTENFGALPGQGGAASYEIDERTGTLSPIEPATERNGQSDTCWVVSPTTAGTPTRRASATTARSRRIGSARTGRSR